MPENRDYSRYFDNAATTPLDERVLREMMPFLRDGFGNANSIHTAGRQARNAVEVARVRVAAMIGADDPAQILFTSGATEANNQVLRSFSKVAVSPFEHSSIHEPAQRLGLEVLTNDGLTVLPPRKRVDLISLMTVNNEIGTIWRPDELAGCARYVHSDITQAAGKLNVSLDGLDFASFSAHKFYGPKGIGALYFKSTLPEPLLVGGEQEHALRGGTLNVPGIVGMGAACAIAQDEMAEWTAMANDLKALLLEGLLTCPGWRLNGGENASPYIVSLSFEGLEGETLVIELDREGYAISSGAACSSQSTEPSHVLRVLNIEEVWARGTVRISFGKYCTREAVIGLSESLRHAVENLRRMKIA